MYCRTCGRSGWLVSGGGRRDNEGKNNGEYDCLCKANDTFSLLANEASRVRGPRLAQVGVSSLVRESCQGMWTDGKGSIVLLCFSMISA